MEKRDRKRNRLPNYDYSQTGCYFVTLCTQNRYPFFQIETDNHQSISNQIIHQWLKETQKKFPHVAIDKYVIMPDHIHMIVNIRQSTPECSLEDIMWYFKTMTTNAYIRYVKSGLLPPFKQKLWQRSYYDHVIRNQQDYNEIWEYIQYNPTKWMLMHSKDKNL